MRWICGVFCGALLGYSLGYCGEVSLTVYNSDLGVVRQSEEMSFQSGVQTVTFTGVPEKIDPTSVRFNVKDGMVTVLEQDYQYDLVNSQKVLERYIDKDISVHLEEGELIEGTLQSVAGDVVLTGHDGTVHIVKVSTIQQFRLTALPEGLITRPTLYWKVNSLKAQKTMADISYMTQGMSWHAEYMAVVSGDEKTMELSAWVSIENNSGAAFKDASLKLVAGEVHRAVPKEPFLRRETMKAMSIEEEAAPFEERGLFEYHLYDLGWKTTIDRAEIKQISLFKPTKTTIQKHFIYDARKHAKRVATTMEFVNAEKSGLGMPLPEGKVRVFKYDKDKAIEFIGEDTINHTPKDEKVRLMLGYAFDLTAERTVTDVRQISPRIREEKIGITLRNRKDEPVEVTVVEHLWGDWEIIEKSHDYLKKDAYTIEFVVQLPSNSESVVTYTARYK